jgi:hypothetical protein
MEPSIFDQVTTDLLTARFFSLRDALRKGAAASSSNVVDWERCLSSLDVHPNPTRERGIVFLRTSRLGVFVARLVAHCPSLTPRVGIALVPAPVSSWQAPFASVKGYPVEP